MQLNSSALNRVALNSALPFVTLELTTAVLTVVSNSAQLQREVSLQPNTIDFSRHLFQNTTINNQDVAAFDFVLPSFNVSEGVTLGAASFGVIAANDAQLAITNNLSAYAFNLTGQDTQQIASTTLDVADLNLSGETLTAVKGVALNASDLNFTGETATPVSVITLSVDASDFVALDVIPSNAPLGEVVNLLTGNFDFTPYTTNNVNSITLTAPNVYFTSSTVQNTTQNKINVVTFDLTPQEITVMQAPRVIDLTTALFKFSPKSVQLTGISSAGDRKRMLFGVGR